MHCTFGQKQYTQDRFIPPRRNTELPDNLGLLDELLEGKDKRETEKMRDDDTPQPELSETQKGYQSLLQNQLLGINDQFTIQQLGGTTHMFQSYPYEQKFSILNGSNTANTHLSHDKENEGCKLPSCCGFLEDDHQLIAPVREDR